MEERTGVEKEDPEEAQDLENREHPPPWAVTQCKEHRPQGAKVTHQDQDRAHPGQQAEEHQASHQSEDPRSPETEQQAEESTGKEGKAHTAHWRQVRT